VFESRQVRFLRVAQSTIASRYAKPLAIGRKVISLAQT
jgi:hypothetical protein